MILSESPRIEILQGRCEDLIKLIPDASIDLLLQDTPFGVTKNSWDIKPDLKLMWREWERIAKPAAAFIFFATQPFASELIMSNLDMFRYDIIWKKTGKPTGFLNAKRMPLRAHEHILVFYKKLPTFNPQKTIGKPFHPRGKGAGKNNVNNNYGEFDQTSQPVPSNEKFPISVIEFSQPHPPLHPTQKPLDMIRYLIRAYSNEGDNIFDGYSGSGTSFIASFLEKRNCIVYEMKQEYIDISIDRLKKIVSIPKLDLK